jgi:HEAT repeat protein
MSGRIRRSLAHSLHVVAGLIGPKRTAEDLLILFYSFLDDMDDEEEVKLGAVRSAAQFLLHLPPKTRPEAFEHIEECLTELNSSSLVAMAVSRDARLALAGDLAIFAQAGLHPKQFARLFLALCKDQSQHVREKAVEIVGLVDLESEYLEVVLAMVKDKHYTWRYLFCCAAKSAQKNNSGLFESEFKPRLQTLKSDGVEAVMSEATRLLGSS